MKWGAPHVHIARSFQHLWSGDHPRQITHPPADHHRHDRSARSASPDGVTASIWECIFPDSSRVIFPLGVSAIRFGWPWRFLQPDPSVIEVLHRFKKETNGDKGFPFKNPPFYGFLWAKIRISSKMETSWVPANMGEVARKKSGTGNMGNVTSKAYV